MSLHEKKYIVIRKILSEEFVSYKTLPLLSDCCQAKNISRLLLLTNVYLDF